MSDTIAPGAFTTVGSYKGPDGADPLAEHITRDAVVLDPADWPVNGALPPVQTTPQWGEDNGDIIADVGGVEGGATVDGFWWIFGPNDGSKGPQVVTTELAAGATLNLTEVDENFGDNWWVCARTHLNEEKSDPKCRTFHAEAPGAAPDAPTNVSVDNATSSQQDVNADFDPNAETHSVERRTGQTGDFEVVAAGLLTSAFPFRVSFLDAEQEYCYRVRSFIEGQDPSPYSDIECETTPAAPPPGEGGGPNEPVGLSVVAHNRFTSLPGANSNWTDAIAGGWRRVGEGALSLSHQGEFDDTPSLEGRWSNGHGPGTGAWRVRTVGEQEYQELYVRIRGRLHGPSGNFNTFENHHAGTKLSWFGVAAEPPLGNNAAFILLQGKGGGEPTIDSAFKLVFHQQGSGGQPTPVAQHHTGKDLIIGQIFDWELHFVLNGIGQSNGILRWWQNGTQILNKSDVVWRNSDTPHGFWRYDNNSTWGGAGGPNKSRHDFYDFFDVYISGVPL